MGRRYRWRHLIYPRHLIVHHATQQRKLTPDTRLGNSSCTFSPSDPHFSNPSYQYHTGEIIANSSVEYNYSSNDQYHTTNSRVGCASLTSSSKNLNNCIIKEIPTVSILSDKASTYSAILLQRSLVLVR